MLINLKIKKTDFLALLYMKNNIVRPIETVERVKGVKKE
jgi:hypothetical protein